MRAHSKSKKSLITIRNLNKAFGSKRVLTGLNLDVFKNESLVILGGSGVGKSVLIKCLIGLIQPDSGSIKLENNEISSLSTQERSDLMNKFGFLFQGGALFDSLTVWKNVAFFYLYNRRTSSEEARHIASETLAKVGLGSSVLDLYPQELSGGMQKRVSFARTIAHNPEILLFDEPTAGLDPIMSTVINELIINVRDNHQSTLITITHDLDSTRKIATRVGMLHEGKIAWTGDIKALNRSRNTIVENFIHGKA